MKRCVVLLLIFITVFNLFSCGRNLSSDELALSLMGLYSDSPPCSQFVKNKNEGEAGYISPEDFAFLYTGQREYLPEWELIHDFRIILSDSSHPFELHVLRAVSSSDTNELEKLLTLRADLISYHNKVETGYLSCEATVFVHGRYAVLAVTPDNNAVKLYLDRYL